MKELEARLWQLIQEAEGKRDANKLVELSSMIRDLDTVKKVIISIKQRLDFMERPSVLPGKTVELIITGGAIRQNYFAVSRLRKINLVPEEGTFEVKTSTGQVFITDLANNKLWLRERGKIAEFYREAGIGPGDKVIWQEIEPRKYLLSRA